MAGTLDLLLRCYLGVQTRGDVLWFDPHLPAEMTRMEVSLQYRSQRMSLTVTDRELTVDAGHGSGHAVSVRCGDEDHRPPTRATIGTSSCEPPRSGPPGTSQHGAPACYDVLTGPRLGAPVSTERAGVRTTEGGSTMASTDTGVTSTSVVRVVPYVALGRRVGAATLRRPLPH